MERIKKLFVLIHIFVWMIFSMLVALQLKDDKSFHWLSATMVFVVTDLYVFYSHFSILTRYAGKLRRKAYFLRLGGVVLTGPFLFALLHYFDRTADHLFYEYYGMALVTIVPAFLFLSWLARVTENLVLNTIKKEQLEKQAVEAELYYLRSQINPHFLFNTLNNIHTLVYKQAPAAPEAVMRLASLMRYMIYESNAHLVPLLKEIEYLKDYVSLQQLRYKMSPVVDLEIKGEAASCKVAPLLFIHLLENAYKHSPARLEPGAIKVSMVINQKCLIFNIQNPISKKNGNELDGPGGIGLQNVRKRLVLLYPDRHELEINTTADKFAIHLKISGIS
jgi:hypothetical protein